MMTAQTIATIRSARLVKVPSAAENVWTHITGVSIRLELSRFPGRVRAWIARQRLPLREAPLTGNRSDHQLARFEGPCPRRRTPLLGFEPRSEAPQAPSLSKLADRGARVGWPRVYNSCRLAAGDGRKN